MHIACVTDGLWGQTPVERKVFKPTGWAIQFLVKDWMALFLTKGDYYGTQ